ncbi:NADAR family protein [Bosea sp. 117]|uniref:NADAR family protein n=1 Tax=Bosea sp. 117 TaxID=1125973 RepID=UPI00068D4BCC|nr:NADAR family protein [Bosea sp. 117]
MKLTLKDRVLALSVETGEEREVCALLAAVDGYVFRLHVASDRGLSFHELGPEDEARRAPLNITHGVSPVFAPISNLARTPFELDGERYASVEGFWQGLKYPDAGKRRTLAKLSGVEAKEAGNPAGQPANFLYGARMIAAGSPEHWALMRMACTAKFTQHAGAREALLATGERWLTHRVRKDSRTIPGAIMADIWMVIRGRLRRGAEEEEPGPAR